MSKLTRYNQDELCGLWRFFAWIDENRSSPTNENSWIDQLSHALEKAWEKCGLEFRGFNSELKSEQRAFILAHWFTYIMDYQMPTKTVWNRAFPIIYHMTKKYVKDELDPNEIREKYFKPFKEKEGYILYLVLPDCKEDVNVKFRHWLMEKDLSTKKGHKIVRSILRALEILDCLPDTRRDLIGFMVRLSEYGTDDWVRRVAVGLHILTYEHNLGFEESIEILSYKDKFNEYFDKIYGTNKIQSWLWHKRTWAALRDYLKGEIYRKFVKPYVENSSFSEEAKEKWRETWKYLYQLELPGDVRNNKFYSIIRSHVKNLFNKNIPKNVLDNAPKAIRLLYEEGVCREKSDISLYPERFDVTYDYANLCMNGLCKICPLYTNRRGDLIKRVCRPTEDGYCPFLLLLGYMVKCDPSKCMLNKEELEKIPRICGGWYNVFT